MRKPFVFDHVIRLVSALALLVSVMISPIRPNVASGVTSSNHLRRNFGIPGKTPSNHRPNVPVPSRIMQVKAVSSESKRDCMALHSALRIGSPDVCAPSLEYPRASLGFRVDLTGHACGVDRVCSGIARLGGADRIVLNIEPSAPTGHAFNRQPRARIRRNMGQFPPHELSRRSVLPPVSPPPRSVTFPSLAPRHFPSGKMIASTGGSPGVLA
jgi:hypothetical protein